MQAASKTLDFIIDTVSAPHSVESYLDLLKVNGKLVIVGVPPHKMEISPMTLIDGKLDRIHTDAAVQLYKTNRYDHLVFENEIDPVG